MNASIQRHYGRREPLPAILRALEEAGIDPEAPSVDELGRFDELHIRGREATRELAGRLQWSSGLRVVDAGSGLGGSSRYLAASHGCRVTAVDLTPGFCAAARELSRRAGVGHRTSYAVGDVTSLPLDDERFDVAWTQHAQMNVADKATMYRELVRVLRPGGRLLFHDIFAGSRDDPEFPVPWAEDPGLSHLASVREVRSLLVDAGARLVDWSDRTGPSLDWARARVVRLRDLPDAEDPGNMQTKLGNLAEALADGRLVVVQAVWRRPR